MIGVGIIGVGYWGPNLVRDMNLRDDARVRYVCDLDQTRLSMIKNRCPEVTATRDYKEAIASPHVDAVVIATPLSMHYPIAQEALAAGKHVLVEKPLAGTVEEAQRLVDTAGDKKLTLMVDHTFVYTGAVEKMREVIQRGGLGDLYYFDSVRINLGLFQKDGNVIWDLAPHDFSILDYLIDEKPCAVSAVGTCHVRRGQENMAYVTVYYKSSFLAHVHVSWLAPAKVRTLIIGGSEKMIVYDDMQASEKVKIYEKGVKLASSAEDGYDALISYRTGDMWAPRLDATDALVKVCAEFAQSISTGSKPRSDGEAGVRVVKLLDAANKSLRLAGQRVDVNI